MIVDLTSSAKKPGAQVTKAVLEPSQAQPEASVAAAAPAAGDEDAVDEDAVDDVEAAADGTV